MKPGKYDKNFFINNWNNLGIGSYKNSDNSPYMIGFSFSGGAGGSTLETNVNNWSKVFGGNYINQVFDGINEFSVWTPEEYKNFWCKAFNYQIKRYNSHWPDVYPSSDCY